MQWIELTLKYVGDNNDEPRKVLQRVDQIGDIFMHQDGRVHISPLYMKGDDYPVLESYEEIMRMLSNCTDMQIIPVITKKDREEELNTLIQWAKQNGYDLSGIQ